jgi:hypothetical protein
VNDRKPIMLTLGEASKACNITKSGISKAIKSGRLSASKNDIGQYEIDPAELFRVFPMKTGNSHLDTNSLHKETSGLQANFDTLRELLHQVEGERNDLRVQRDRLLNIIEEQAGNIKQLTYKPVDQDLPKRITVRPWLWVVFIVSIIIAASWFTIKIYFV